MDASNASNDVHRLIAERMGIAESLVARASEARAGFLALAGIVPRELLTESLRGELAALRAQHVDLMPTTPGTYDREAEAKFIARRTGLTFVGALEFVRTHLELLGMLDAAREHDEWTRLLLVARQALN